MKNEMKKCIVICVILAFAVALLLPAVLFVHFGSTECTYKFDQRKIEQIPEIEYIHFSIDDCNGIFEDLTSNEYESIFDQDKLGFLKGLHDQYGIVVSFYVYYDWDLESEGFDLSQATSAYQLEFTENSDWLKFGFHAADANAYENDNCVELMEYYEKTIKELLRITGSQSCIDSFVRLDRYTANETMIESLRTAAPAIEGLFIADRADAQTRASYALTAAEREQCYSNDWYVDSHGMAYTPTDIRLESITDDTAFYQLLNSMSHQRNLIVFSHEWALTEGNVQKYMTMLAEYAHEYNIAAGFPEEYT